MSVAIVIPARYESSRFPGKPIAEICGKPMIIWVIEAALKAKHADKIIVATDDKRIYDCINEYSILNNGKIAQLVSAQMTSSEHKSGTDRIAEIVRKDSTIQYIINLQGDEPLISPEYIDKVVEPLLDNKQCPKSNVQMCTLIAPITDVKKLNNSNDVKALFDKDGFAITFSRLPIPFEKGIKPSSSSILGYHHYGIYSYTREALLQFSELPQSPLEKKERLEQLRALENGIKIKLEVVPHATQAVDMPEDIKLVENILLASTQIQTN